MHFVKFNWPQYFQKEPFQSRSLQMKDSVYANMLDKDMNIESKSY